MYFAPPESSRLSIAGRHCLHLFHNHTCKSHREYFLAFLIQVLVLFILFGCYLVLIRYILNCWINLYYLTQNFHLFVIIF